MKENENEMGFVSGMTFFKMDIDQQIDHIENLCVKHIILYKNVIYSPIEKDVIFITNKLKILFHLLAKLIKQKNLKLKKKKYDLYAKYNPDLYDDNVKLPHIKFTRVAGFKVYGGFIDIDRDIELEKEIDVKDPYQLILFLLKNNIFNRQKNLYYKMYKTGQYVDIKYISLYDYLNAHSDESQYISNVYYLTKKKDALLTFFDVTYTKIKKLWRIELDHTELAYIQQIFYNKEFTVFKDMRPFMRLRYEIFFERFEYHNFQVIFLFPNVLFCVFFIITQEVGYYLPTRRGNHLLFIDTDGTKYYLSETVKSVRRSLDESTEYITDYLEEVNDILIKFDNISIEDNINMDNFQNLKKVNEIVLSQLDKKLDMTNFFFKINLEKMAKKRILENITQKDWFESIIKDAGYWNQICLFSSIKFFDHPLHLKKGLILCLEIIARQIRNTAFEVKKADDRLIQRESEIGIANAIRSWQEENIEEIRLEVEKKKKELEEIKKKREVWVIQKMKEIDERNAEKEIFLQERKKILEEKKKKIEARKILMKEKKKIREEKAKNKKIKPIIFTPEEEREYQIKKIKYYQEYLEYEQELKDKELRLIKRKELQEKKEERKKIREIKHLEKEKLQKEKELKYQQRKEYIEKK